jgi:hypothetical protein
MANIVSRHFSTVQNVGKINCTEFGSIVNADPEHFIPITNVFASPILVVPFDSIQKPIIINRKKFKPATIQYCSSSNIIDHMFLFDLFPQQTKYLLYDNRKNYNIFEQT